MKNANFKLKSLAFSRLYRNPRNLIDVMLSKAKHLAFSGGRSRDSSAAPQNDIAAQSPDNEKIRHAGENGHRRRWRWGMIQTLDSGVRRNDDTESYLRVEQGSVSYSILRSE